MDSNFGNGANDNSIGWGRIYKCDDTTVNVNDTEEGTFSSGSILDIQITDGTDPVTPDAVVVTGDTIEIQVPAASTPVGATLLKTGQTTSYRTGDDGDLEAGRATNFTTLAVANPFGNTNRFTDELGGQTYTNNIVIDWSTYDGSTVLGYRRVLTSADTLDNVIAACSALNVAGFTGWRLTNYKELFNTYIANGNVLTNNYSPFNVGSKIFWTNTTTGATSAWISYNYLALPLDNAGVGAINYGMPCRDFTVTGTTLS